MQKKYDINNIRRLVDKFYQGSTSLEEEQLLTEFFHQQNIANIPEDMLAEVQVFGNLARIMPRSEELQIPEDLEAKVESIVEEPSHRFSFRRMMALTRDIAAMLFLFWAMGVIWIQGPKTERLRTQEIAAMREQASRHQKKTRVKSEEAPIIIEEQSNDVASAPKRESHCMTPKKHIATATVKPVEVEPTMETSGDGFEEITDPDEARQLLQQIENLLAANVNESTGVIEKVNTSLESNINITKSFLQ